MAFRQEEANLWRILVKKILWNWRGVTVGLVLVAAGTGKAGVIAGRITDASNGAPVSWANVVVEGTVLGAAADREGRYVVKDVPDGEYRLTVSAVGYAEQTKLVKMDGLDVAADFRLAGRFVEVAPVETRGEAPVRNLGDGPVARQVVSREDIEAKGAGNLQEALQAEPGCKVASCCPVSGEGEIQLQGLPGKYTAVVLDGMPGMADLGCYGLAHVPVTGIERIEITSGAGGLGYGGDAFGGVVNVVSRDVSRTGGTARVDGGSFGTYGIQATVDASGNALDASATVSKRHTAATDINSDGMSDFVGSGQSGLTIRLRVRPHERLGLTLSGYSWHDERQGGDMERLAGRARDGVYENPNISSYGPMAVLRWQTTDFALLTARVSYSGYRQRVYSHERWFDAREEVVYADAQYSGRMPLNQKLNVTLFHRRERVAENTAVEDRGALSTGLVAEDEFSLGPVLVAGTGRLEHYTLHGVRFMPAVSAVYAPVGSIRLRGSLGAGFKAAPLFSKMVHFCVGQEQSEFIQNPELGPERSGSGRLSAEFRRADLSFSAGAFRSRIYDMVFDSMVGLDTVRQVRQYQQYNRGTVVTQGLELGAAWRPLPSMLLQVGYTLLDARDIGRNEALPYRARHTANWAAGYRIEPIGLDLNVSGEFVGRMPTQRREGEHLLPGPLSPNHALWHVRAAKRWRRAGPDAAGLGVETFVAMRNILNYVQSDWISAGVPLWGPTRGRWLTVGVDLAF